MALKNRKIRGPDTGLTGILTPLMSAGILVNLSGAMFAVAVPVIRKEFSLSADTASWLIIAHNLPFILFIQLYGKFSDILGKRNLLFFGLLSYFAGSALLLSARDFPLILAARTFLGLGTAGIIPLSIAIISQHARPHQQGKALGIWNSSGPVSGISGPLAAGFIISAFSWQSIMWIVIFFALLSMVLLRFFIPPDQAVGEKPLSSVIKGFDWPGVLFFNGVIVFIVFFTSSRPITGKPPLTDLRLLSGMVFFLTAFILFERKRKNPFIDFSFIKDRNLTCASLAVCSRMITLGGIFLVIPLMASDLYHFTPAETGLVLVLNSAAMLIATHTGGILIDRWKCRRQIILGLLMQAGAMLLFLFTPETLAPLPFFSAVIIHGLGAGVSIAALHLFALSGVPENQSGSRAGIYSTIRYSGRLFGAAFGGSILQSGLDHHGITPAGYTPVFLFYLTVSLLGAAAALGLTKKIPCPANPRNRRM